MKKHYSFEYKFRYIKLEEKYSCGKSVVCKHCDHIGFSSISLEDSSEEPENPDFLYTFIINNLCKHTIQHLIQQEQLSLEGF